MKVLCLIIANALPHSVVYDGLHEEWLRYMNIDSEIKSYFITFDNKLESDYKIDNEKSTILFKGNESYVPGIYEKTILAMKICLSLPEFSDVKYVIRTNISSFWIWDRLLAFLEN